MKNLCDSGNCPHGKSRETCTELCLEAVMYADQDYVGEQRIPILKNWQSRTFPDLKDKAREVRLFHRQGKSYEEISIHLECDEDFIREVLEDD